MSMKSKIQITNNLKPSDDGTYIGEIVSLNFGEGTRTIKTSEGTDQLIYPRFEMVTEFEGTQCPIKITTYTGTSINGEPLEIKYKGRGKANEKPIYNQFTTLLIQLGFLEVEDLGTLTVEYVAELEEVINTLKGDKIKASIGKNKGGYFTLELGSVELVRNTPDE